MIVLSRVSIAIFMLYPVSFSIRLFTVSFDNVSSAYNLIKVNGSNIASNNKRLTQYTEAFNKDKVEFIKSEKKRVEDFQYLYKMTIIIASVCFAVAICFFLFTNNHVLKAIGIALIIFGLTGLIIDYFSKERADNYYKAITTEIESHYS